MTVRFCKRFAILAVLAGAALLVGPSPAQAAFTLSLSDGTTTTTVTDQTFGPSGDLDPASGQIIFSGAIGVFNVNISVGTSNAPNGFPALLTINNTSISAAGLPANTSSTLTLVLQDTGFMGPAGSVTAETQLSTTQLPANTTVTGQTSVNGTPLTLITLNTVGGGRVFDTVNIATTPFTLTNTTTFTVVAGPNGSGPSTVVQFTGLTSVTPEPGTMAMAFSALPLLGLGYWRHRRRQLA